jgi:hypothetical protein
MLLKLIKKYFSIVFLLSAFLSVTHHHNDLQTHSDCKICVLQSNVVNADTPIITNYLPNIELHYQKIIFLTQSYTEYKRNFSHIRAPPSFS